MALLSVVVSSLVLALASCVVYSSHTHDDHSHIKPRIDHGQIQSTGFNWTAKPALPYLDYQACYDGFECSRLEVPLDWNNASNLNKVELAVIRLPASVPVTDPSFGGTILINPGGPGGSGIDVMRWTARGIAGIVDGEKHFELLSWDPRGVQHTTPPVSCFADDFQRDVWAYRNTVIGPMDASNMALGQKWALSQGLGALCEQNNLAAFSDGSNVAKYVTTALVVRDMLEIIDQVELHRSQLSVGDASARLQQSLGVAKPALLNYWGYSYGSYLGNTFASMFPSRIGRMILDSVVDVDDYTATGWFSNLVDYNKSLNFFYQDCYQAGRRCPLNDANTHSPHEIENKVNDLLMTLKTRPVVVSGSQEPNIVTFADVATLLLTTMYYPTWSWPELAQILADLMQNNATLLVPHLPRLGNPSDQTDDDILGTQLLEGRNRTNAYPPSYPHAWEAAKGVLCGDGDDIRHLTAEDWAKRLAVMHGQSPITGWLWAEHTMSCVHWPESWKPNNANRFKGPWSTKFADYDSRASPLLFVGGTGDPVLPLRNAYKAAAEHEEARVLIQNAPGHCSGYINPVSCTWGHIRRFFTDGILPENNTVCDRDGTAWSLE